MSLLTTEVSRVVSHRTRQTGDALIFTLCSYRDGSELTGLHSNHSSIQPALEARTNQDQDDQDHSTVSTAISQEHRCNTKTAFARLHDSEDSAVCGNSITM